MGKGIFEIVNFGIEAGRKSLSSGASSVSERISRLLCDVGSSSKVQELESLSYEEVPTNNRGEWSETYMFLNPQSRLLIIQLSTSKQQDWEYTNTSLFPKHWLFDLYYLNGLGKICLMTWETYE